MKKILITAFTLLVLLKAGAAPLALTFNKGEVTISGESKIKINTAKSNTGYTEILAENCVLTGAVGEPQLPVFTQLVALPENGNFALAGNNLQYEEITLTSPLIHSGVEDVKAGNIETYAKNEWYPKEPIRVGAPVIMAGSRFSQVAFYPVQYNPAANKIRVAKNIQLNFNLDLSINENPIIKTKGTENSSPVIKNMLSGMVKGLAKPKAAQEKMASYLIIAPTGFETSLNYLIKWKRQLGYKTVLKTVSSSVTESMVKNIIQTAYNNPETRPDFVLLIGDVNGSIKMPTGYCQGYLTPTVPTDHKYAMLEGNDYFPDVMIGRISVQTTSQLNTVINKIIKYESAPSQPYTWLKRALMVSLVDNYNENYLSGKETVLAVKDKLLDFGYNEVETFIEPEQLGAANLRSRINTGFGFVNYRGFGGTYYWQGANNTHVFEINDINQLSNGFQLPMITSIVCGGGDFATSNYQTCFGETWLAAGTSTQPKGGIGFIGPSEHDTKTPFNNCNDQGIYQGIAQENIVRCGEMLLRGKMELYNNFPDCHAWGNALNSDQFYFYVYNLLGDPGLKVWTDTPKGFDFTMNESMTEADNCLSVTVSDLGSSDLSGFMVSVLANDTIAARAYTYANGKADLAVSLKTGTYQVTLSKTGFVPAVKQLTVTAGQKLELADFSFSSELQAGKTATISCRIKNGTAAAVSAINCTLLSNSGLIAVSGSPVVIESIGVSETKTVTFTVVCSEEWNKSYTSELFLMLNYSSQNQKLIIPVKVTSPEISYLALQIENSDQALLQNQNNSFKIKLKNSGLLPTEEFSTVLTTASSKVTVLDSLAAFSSINTNSEGLSGASFRVNLTADNCDGEPIWFKLKVLKNSRIVQNIIFSAEAGKVTQQSLTYSKSGYVAIESRDTHPEAPVYSWTEISPYSGGSGVQINGTNPTSDGFTQRRDLPFPFKYFGKSYNSVVIASNGTISFGRQESVFYSNKTIPSGNGPAAMIAPLWDTFKQGYVYCWNDSINHKFFVEWKNMRNAYDQNKREYFEVVLFDPAFYPTETGDGKILFVYQQVNNVDVDDNYATVGIENEDKNDGLLITYANRYAASAHQLANETAILFKPVTAPTVAHISESAQITSNKLFNNYPNPFNNSTVIDYQILTNDFVKLAVYNAKGELVKNLINATQTAGRHSVTFKADGLNSGVYYIKMQSGRFNSVQKCLLVK